MQLESRIFISRTPEEVGHFLGDISNISKWDRGVGSATQTSGGAMAVGTEFETLGTPGTRDGAGTQGKMSYRVAEVGANHCTVELRRGGGNARFFKKAQWDFRVEPAPGGSLIVCCASFVLKLRYVVLAPVFYMMRGAIQADLRRLKQAVEES